MNKSAKTLTTTHKLALAGVLCAVAVVGSLLSFPVLGSKCAPVQHMVNILCAVVLGPWYGVGVAFVASLVRNILGIGSLMAFPGSMCGALLCGVAFWKSKNLPLTLIAEVFGTGIIGGFAAYPHREVAHGPDPRGLHGLYRPVPHLHRGGLHPRRHSRRSAAQGRCAGSCGQGLSVISIRRFFRYA